MQKPNKYKVPLNAHGEEREWPPTAPPLEAVCEWVRIFFDRNCFILDLGELVPGENCILWCGPEGGRERRLTGRVSADKKRFQTRVDGLLNQLQGIKDKGVHNGCTLVGAFAVIGITFTDLYSCDEDLFIAGMAAARQGSAVLSYHRYHPRIKMCPFHWDDYGYISKSSNYSYYEDNKRRPRVVEEVVPFASMDHKSRSEFIRRAGKLLVHELLHVYGIAHCIYHHCLMNGTGTHSI